MGLLDNEDKDDFSGYILRRQYEMDEAELPRRKGRASPSAILLTVIFLVAVGVICWIFRKP